MTAPIQAAATMLGTGFVFLGLYSIAVAVVNRGDPKGVQAGAISGAFVMWCLMFLTALVSTIGTNAWIVCQ